MSPLEHMRWQDNMGRRGRTSGVSHMESQLPGTNNVDCQYATAALTAHKMPPVRNTAC